MIHYASSQAKHASNSQFQVGTAEALSLQSDHFDVVVSSLFMHHLPYDLQLAALREMWRVLRPGGTLLIAEAHVPRALVGNCSPDCMATTNGARGCRSRTQHRRCQFEQLSSGEAPPWLRYVRATKQTVS